MSDLNMESGATSVAVEPTPTMYTEDDIKVVHIIIKIDSV